MVNPLTLSLLAQRANQPRRPLIERPSAREERQLKLSDLRGNVQDAEAERQQKAQIQQIWRESGGDLERAGTAIMAINPQLGDTILAEATRRKQAQATAARQGVLQGREDEQYGRKEAEFARTEDERARNEAAIQAGYGEMLEKTGQAPNAALEWKFRQEFGKAPAPRRLQNVPQGHAVIDEDSGETVFENPAAEKPEVRDPKIGTTIETAQGIMQWNPASQRYDIPAGKAKPNQGPQGSFVQGVGKDGKPIFYNPVTGQQKNAPEGFGSLPTADQRNRQDTGKKLNIVVGRISDLSEKINTGKGIEAKARGEVEKQKARLNYNDDVAEYESIIAGYTPIVARATGHVGVLTQPDVDSVRELFPKPGDSKTLRDRKIGNIKLILGNAEGDFDVTAGPAAAPGKVLKYDAKGNRIP